MLHVQFGGSWWRGLGSSLHVANLQPVPFEQWDQVGLLLASRQSSQSIFQGGFVWLSGACWFLWYSLPPCTSVFLVSMWLNAVFWEGLDLLKRCEELGREVKRTIPSWCGKMFYWQRREMLNWHYQCLGTIWWPPTFWPLMVQDVLWGVWSWTQARTYNLCRFRQHLHLVACCHKMSTMACRSSGESTVKGRLSVYIWVPQNRVPILILNP